MHDKLKLGAEYLKMGIYKISDVAWRAPAKVTEKCYEGLKGIENRVDLKEAYRKMNINKISDVAWGAQAKVTEKCYEGMKVMGNKIDLSEAIPKMNVNKTTIAVVAGGAAISVAGAVVILPVLGFSTAGVGAGTIAAGVHSAIGNVAAGSLFASCQSAGVLGLAATTKVGAGLAGGAAAGIGKKLLWDV